MSARYAEPMVSASEVEVRVAAARETAETELRDHYQAQLNDVRQEAVAFHQQILGSLETALERWMQQWEAQVPELVFAGVRAVLSDFELTDEQLDTWVRRALAAQVGGEKTEVEIRLSPDNARKLEAYWAENELGLPPRCRLKPDSSCTAVECRLVGEGGILDASLTSRLSQLQRLWKLDA
ncbi:MAG: FliH/SctL family protein [Opitutales bacterium]